MKALSSTLLCCALLIIPIGLEANVRLTDNTASSQRPVVAIDSFGSSVVVVWQDNRDGNSEIYWRRFTELGEPLTDEIRVTNTAATSVRPDVSCDGSSRSYLVWQEGQGGNGEGTVCFCILDSQGARVLPADVQLSTLSLDARIYTRSNGISDVVWQKFTATDQDVYYRRVSATGTNLCEQRFNKGTIPSYAKHPAVADANGTAAIYWRDMQPMFDLNLYEGAVYPNCTKGSGVMYSQDSADYPDVDALETTNIVWPVFQYAGRIYNYLGGGNACAISSASGAASLPRVATDGSKAFLVWQDSRDGNNEIYMCRFTDCPSETGDQRLTNDTASSERPDIAAKKDGDGAWVAVWQDNRDGNWEIYMTGTEIRGRGWVAGRVTRVGGSPVIEGATVVLSQGGIEVATTTTGADGRYQTDLVLAGSYDLEVSAICYHTYEEAGVELGGGLATTRDIEMHLTTPTISGITPSSVMAGDTGVDILIAGTNFVNVDTLLLDTDDATVNYFVVWSESEIHANISIEDSPDLDELQVRVVRTCGDTSAPFTLPVHSFGQFSNGQGKHPRYYAPTFWFSGLEEWFPTTPLFKDGHGETYYESNPARLGAYLSLEVADRRQLGTVYYDVRGDDEECVGFPGVDDTRCMVYEYWLYYVYDEFDPCGSGAWNKHYHDWEKFFVFVDSTDGTVRGVVGSAHLEFTPNNVYEYPDGREPFHPTVLVELGAHAMCPDADEDGEFDRQSDINGCEVEDAWGIKERETDRDPEDRITGPDGGAALRYGLASLGSLQEIVDPRFTEEVDCWEGSHESVCISIGCPDPRSHLFYRNLKKQTTYLMRTFIGSTVIHYDPASDIVRLFRRFCESCWDESFVLAVGHMPIEHAWAGDQNQLRVNPREILPACYWPPDSEPSFLTKAYAKLHGPYGPDVCIVGFGLLMADLVIPYEAGDEGTDRQVSADSTAPLSFGWVDENGDVCFHNLREGIYGFYLDPDGAAPYEQLFRVSESDTLLGAGGNIYLAPEDAYFTLEVAVTSGCDQPASLASVHVYAEPDSLLLPTLTDSVGLAYAYLDTAGTYKVTVGFQSYESTVTGITGSLGDTVSLSFVTADHFTRGDDDGDGELTISDPILSLCAQFGSGCDLTCFDASDVDDDGEITISDAIYNLNAQFGSGAVPPAPFPDCGPDPTADGLDCSCNATCMGFPALAVALPADAGAWPDGLRRMMTAAMPAEAVPASREIGTDPTARAVPNPSSGAMSIVCEAAAGGPVEVTIYNTAGQVVRSLSDARAATGTHTLMWDGRADDGSAVPAGVYFCRIETSGREYMKKVVVAR